MTSRFAAADWGNCPIKPGDELNEDPLHGFLVGLKLFAEMLADLPQAHPGCLAASFAYQDQLFNDDLRKLNADGMLAWRSRFRERLRIIAERYAPRHEVDLDAPADTAYTLVEGGFPRPCIAGLHNLAAAGAAVPRLRAHDLYAGAGLVSGRRTPVPLCVSCLRKSGYPVFAGAVSALGPRFRGNEGNGIACSGIQHELYALTPLPARIN